MEFKKKKKNKKHVNLTSHPVKKDTDTLTNECLPYNIESSSSDEEDYELPFWNNWLPPFSQPLHEIVSTGNKEVTSKFVCNPSLFSTKACFARFNCGNWIPPLNFNFGTEIKSKIKEEINVYDKVQRNKVGKKQEENSENCKDTNESHETYLSIVRSGSDVLPSWKGRVQLHDVTSFNDGDLIWGVVNLGVFVHIKLWVDELGRVCGSADGKISKVGCKETTFISITNLELLRKILGLSNAQWASLCETVQETKAVLKFDAYQDFKLTSKTKLEKLWFFICKRRHFLPSQCMLVKLSGAVKCMRNFKIIPKVIVQETEKHFKAANIFT